MHYVGKKIKKKATNYNGLYFVKITCLKYQVHTHSCHQMSTLIFQKNGSHSQKCEKQHIITVPLPSSSLLRTEHCSQVESTLLHIREGQASNLSTKSSNLEASNCFPYSLQANAGIDCFLPHLSKSCFSNLSTILCNAV